MIRRGSLTVDPALLEWVLRESESTKSTKMSTDGEAWHWLGRDERGDKMCAEFPFLRAAVALTEESSPLKRIRWWANVLRAGAEYRKHRHDGKWGFVYHLTAGSALHFLERDDVASFDVTPGQLIVFKSEIRHWTDEVVGEAPRVSIAGNLYFSSSRQ